MSQSNYNTFSTMPYIPYKRVMALVENNNLFKLLYYPTKDALSQPNLTLEQKVNMIWNGQDRTDDYTIFLTNIQPNLETISRPVLKIYRYDTLPKTYTTAVISYEFDILFGTKIPMVDYNGVPCNRGDLIEMELMKSLNGQDVAGVGYLQYNHQLSTLDRSRIGIGNNSTFTGYYFIMSTIYTDVGRVDGCNS